MTLGYALGFQHSPRNLANVNEWIITFDPYIKNYYEAKIVTCPADNH